MTEEEKKEYKHQWYLKKKEKILERQKQRYQEKREELIEKSKDYYVAHKEERLAFNRKYKIENKEKILEKTKKWLEKNPDYHKQWYEENKEKRLMQMKKYNLEYAKTPMGRASYLNSMYKQSDKKANRGECTLTAKWIVDNIFSKPCKHCGKTGWKIIGCNRLDNDKPHTPDNVEPCCFECNCKISGGRPKFLKK